jgi:hypothetical protein
MDSHSWLTVLVISGGSRVGTYLGTIGRWPDGLTRLQFDRCLRRPSVGSIASRKTGPGFTDPDGATMHKSHLCVSWALASLATPLCGCGPDSRPDQPPGKIAAAHQEQPVIPPHIAAELDAPSVPEPTPSEPVKAAMALRPTKISPGMAGELLVAVRIARAHYLHAEADHGGTFTPLKIEATLPPGVEFVGDWSFPAPEKGRNGVPIYRTSVLLRRTVKFTSASQTLGATAMLRYQACNEELCWPPGKLVLSVPLPMQAEATR